MNYSATASCGLLLLRNKKPAAPCDSYFKSANGPDR